MAGGDISLLPARAAPPSPARPNLLDFDFPALAVAVRDAGGEPYRARQLFSSLHRFGARDWDDIASLPLALRRALAASYAVAAPRLAERKTSADGCDKLLFDAGDGGFFEAVLIPEERRATLCVSSQAGCALACRFCSTGVEGFSRNLTTAEIVGQIQAARALPRDESAPPISNVVFMGMGEPLLNLAALAPALSIITAADGLAFAPRRVTVSTAGIAPAIERLTALDRPVSLALSLHAPDDELRDRLMPINRKYPLAQVLAACRAYIARSRRAHITFEYVMLAGVNDSEECALRLLRLARSLRCKVNLIPFNGFPGAPFEASDADRIADFRAVLTAGRVAATIRKTRGDSIFAACGQLAGQARGGKKISIAVAQ